MKKIFSITMLVMLTALFGQTAFAQNTQQTETNAQDVNKFTTRLENPNAKNPSSLIAEIKPGGTYEGSIIVINKGTQPTEINLYGADAKVKDDGDSTITFQNEKQTGIGAWTTINPAKIRLEPGEEKPAKITISVPADTELKEYKGGIAATGPEENGEQ